MTLRVANSWKKRARCASANPATSPHVADSDREQPYRPHLPHPRAYWAYFIADVRVVGAPTNPVDGETVVEVLTLPPAAAADYIEEHDPIHADVLRHAEAMGLVHP